MKTLCPLAKDDPSPHLNVYTVWRKVTVIVCLHYQCLETHLIQFDMAAGSGWGGIHPSVRHAKNKTFPDFHYAPRDFSVWLVTIHLGSDFWANRSKGNLGAVFQVALLSHFATPFFKYSRIRHHCYLLINSTVFKVKYFVIICAYVCDYSWKWQPVLEFTPSLLLTNLILNFKFLHKGCIPCE